MSILACYFVILIASSVWEGYMAQAIKLNINKLWIIYNFNYNCNLILSTINDNNNNNYNYNTITFILR